MEILKKLGKKGRLIAFDQDEDAAANVPEDGRVTFVPHNFRYLKKYCRLYGAIPANGILADLGVSSRQLDNPERGFSIRYDARLDMRMDRRQGERDAREVLNACSEEELHRIFGMYGEVQNARTLARSIVMARARQPIDTVADLKAVVAPLARKGSEHKYHAQVFQALRIEVNGELEALRELLLQSVDVLGEEGRLAVISYHSLEDRMVKNFIGKGKFGGEVEKDLYGNEIKPFDALMKKALKPGPGELARNSRARSARLRIAVKR